MSLAICSLKVIDMRNFKPEETIAEKVKLIPRKEKQMIQQKKLMYHH